MIWINLIFIEFLFFYVLNKEISFSIKEKVMKYDTDVKSIHVIVQDSYVRLSI